jgi:hypothetical protein
MSERTKKAGQWLARQGLALFARAVPDAPEVVLAAMDAADAARSWKQRHPRLARTPRFIWEKYKTVMGVSTFFLAATYARSTYRAHTEMQQTYEVSDRCDEILDKAQKDIAEGRKPDPKGCDLEKQLAHRAKMANETLLCAGFAHPCAGDMPRLFRLAQPVSPAPIVTPSAPVPAIPPPRAAPVTAPSAAPPAQRRRVPTPAVPSASFPSISER